MQPTDHKSMAAVYFSCSRMSSGARYHLVTTCPVRCRRAGWRAAVGGRFSSPTPLAGRSSGSSSPPMARERPKSQIFTEQSWLTKQFAGFKSRCMMPAECRYLTPINKLYSKVLMCNGVNVTSVRHSFLRSESQISMTMYNSSKFAEGPGVRISWTCTTKSWLSRDKMATSRRMRLQSIKSSKRWRTRFTATSRSCSVSWASQTLPYEPVPITCRTS
mmetsp:Transcript_113799/g.327026  ORF Transcript_113799/g.327026 Transcript_113799/m.327026 type:complete len:217 (-) Transcript_113799:181-831(-)